MRRKTFAFWTGPCAVDQVALRLSQAGFHNVRAGTERVYFQMSETWEQAAGEDLLHEARRQVHDLYPHAGFDVYEV